MKKLICVKDVENVEKKGQKVFYIDSNTIITPSAKDAAKACGIEFSTETPVCAVKTSEANVCEVKNSQAQACAAKNSCEEIASSLAKASDGGIDTDMIYKVFKAMMDKGLLNGILDSFSNKPYIAEVDPCGLKVVRGSSVKMEVLDTGNPSDKVFYQEIINIDDGCKMNAGVITIEGCSFDWETACQELYYVIEGTLTVTVDGKIYTAHSGDSVFFPKGAKLAFGSPDKMKAFYATY
ncbi:cupin domain-containing protein [Clostridium tagluense]|uniref:cupin domain-containing protein n=1 Tax=Clostridium TaxID=1485 RepID=UPI0013E98925|nr:MULTISPECIES: cupin domain-containing protein [Clostridium]MBU3128286.1 cupin domain-containing protein [Clostridium tagluense]MBZ9622737.1 cupin domain-containing protein [Clostridium sp. FP2]MCB2310771.1 cupin domain-containing protein [Clostridium tagluense]MCB2315499.1 cupin domain-containing protein [Clostridium tagluense]MCB2320352.1 cupin domain-containing protein [Clostridium tagluense]